RLQREREALLARERVARAEAERASRARDEVLAIVSHDLRNPLSTIVMSARALTESPAATSSTTSSATSAASRADLARIIARAGEWALRIIRDLLDVAAIEAGRLAIHPERMTVQAIAERLQSLVRVPAQAAGVEFSVAVEDAPRWIEADVDRTVQAVGNLVANALKFTPPGGQVRVRISRGAAELVAFRVEDTGTGIAPEHLPHLFDRFWQAGASHRGGAGLGLAIARGIAEGHGGRVEVESVPGQGSTFTLLLPAGA
ncbi:MAG: sensor histidine kinase, partial [Gemmatirosa sp.]